jgi:hypothetical protein
LQIGLLHFSDSALRARPLTLNLLAQCIGRRNYLAFFLFLISTTLLASLSIALSTIHVALGGLRWDWQRIGALVVLALTAVVSAPVGCLAIYHVGLACAQRTTIEMVRIRAQPIAS